MKKNLEYYRKNAEENYLTTPLSVLRYIGLVERRAYLLKATVFFILFLVCLGVILLINI